MDIEKLYQDVWVRVFAEYATRPGGTLTFAQQMADEVASEAVARFDFKRAQAAIAAKAAQA